jgi:hypothetical protein
MEFWKMGTSSKLSSSVRKIISKTMVMILLKKGAIVAYHYIYHWAQSIFKFKFSMDEVAEYIHDASQLSKT